MSIVPGESIIVVEENAIGSIASSETQNPFTPVEFGRTLGAGGLSAKVKADDADGYLPYEGGEGG